LDFGEAGDAKGVCIVEGEPGRPVRVRAVDLSSGVRLIKLSGSLEQVAAAAEGLEGSYVKVEIDEPLRAGLAEEVRRIVPGAVDVVMAGPGHSGDRPNRAAARLGRQPRELFAEYLAQRSIDDPALIDLFSELLEEAHEA
jgi:exonuclease SbcD